MVTGCHTLACCFVTDLWPLTPSLHNYILKAQTLMFGTCFLTVTDIFVQSLHTPVCAGLCAALLHPAQTLACRSTDTQGQEIHFTRVPLATTAIPTHTMYRRGFMLLSPVMAFHVRVWGLCLCLYPLLIHRHLHLKLCFYNWLPVWNVWILSALHYLVKKKSPRVIKVIKRET